MTAYSSETSERLVVYRKDYGALCVMCMKTANLNKENNLGDTIKGKSG